VTLISGRVWRSEMNVKRSCSLFLVGAFSNNVFFEAISDGAE
jgi:hypothetical protein